MKKSRQAFTLVELLVVITIIGILAGIALPVFQKAQERGKAISDLSNLRQLGLAVQTYRSNNDNNIFDSAGSVWPQQLFPQYVSTWKILRSPFDKRLGTESTSSPVSYGLNNEGTTKLLGMDGSKINFPSNLILFGPTVDTANTTLAYAPNIGTSTCLLSTPHNRGSRNSWHRKRVNAVFADGHAEDLLWLKFKDKASAEEDKKRWLPDYEEPAATP